MNGDILRAIKETARNKGLEEGLIFGALEAAFEIVYVNALEIDVETGENVRIDINRENGEMKAFLCKADEETGEESVSDIKIRELGWKDAQKVKQLFNDNIRKAQQIKIHDEFIEKVGTVVTGIVQHLDRGDIYLDIGSVDALLPAAEQIKGENIKRGSRTKVYIKNVYKESKGEAQIIVSRKHEGLVLGLFEIVVAEIEDGYVKIEKVVRDPGRRAKIAVSSRSTEIDPVGACVGNRGERVREVVNELNGERIDVIEWQSDYNRFIAESLKPAKSLNVVVNDSERVAKVLVHPDQLSLAIGKGGQNVKLARELVGFNRIDVIQLSDDVEEMIEESIKPCHVEKVLVNEAENSAVLIVDDGILDAVLEREMVNLELTREMLDLEEISVMTVSEYEEDSNAKTEDSQQVDR